MTMNFEPPDFRKDVQSNRNMNLQVRNNHYQSPLLQHNKPTNFNKTYSSVKNNKPHTSHFNGAVHNRLGNRHSYGGNNVDSVNLNNERNDNMDMNFNRKRKSNDGNTGPKRKWNRNKFYANSNHNLHNNSAQDRMNRIRTSNQNLNANTSVEVKACDPPDISNPNESQDFDATDITVEVINTNAQPKEELNPVRFKMILDPKTQAAIRSIQQKRKDKQVIFPFPVTPNTTGVSLHERFTVL